MEYEEVVKHRYMCRKYEDRNLSEGTLDQLLDLAARYPSAGHTQPQEFIIVKDQNIQDQLGRAALGQMYLAQAPVVVVVVSDTQRSAARYGERGVKFYSIIDGAFASMLLLLAAVDQGLGAAFVGAFDDAEVQRVMGLPDHVRPIGIISIGYCAEGPRQLSRRSKRDIIHHEQWEG